jgi:hypothetical protein
MFAESTNRWPILAAFWEASCSGKIGGRFCVLLFFRNVFFGPDLLQFYGSFFYYKYRHCISVNLEIEGAETRV